MLERVGKSPPFATSACLLKVAAAPFIPHQDWRTRHIPQAQTIVVNTHLIYKYSLIDRRNQSSTIDVDDEESEATQRGYRAHDAERADHAHMPPRQS